MASYATLPLEIRLHIYEMYLADWFDKPATHVFPRLLVPKRSVYLASLMMPWTRREAEYAALLRMIKFPVPPVLKVETVEARSRLLKWLAKHKGVSPNESAAKTSYLKGEYTAKRDFLYLRNHEKLEVFTESLSLEPEHLLQFRDSYGHRIRRIALPAPIRHSQFFSIFLKRLEILRPDELALIFAEMDQGELKLINSVPKNNPAAYTLERLSDGDITAFPQELRRSIAGLDTSFSPLIWYHDMPAVRRI